MRAAIWEEPGRLSIGTREDPTPEAGEVVVQVGACGLCGTDLHIADGEFPPTPYPIVPGHEFAGEVVAVGPQVRGLREGMRIAADPSLFCGHCTYCRMGRGNLCENWNAIGDTVDGAFAEFVRVPIANAYPLPEELDDRAGALVEPVSCAVHALHRLNVRAGASVLVVGAGTMGLILVQLLRRGGAAQIDVADANPAKLPLARALGADGTVGSASEARQDLREQGYDIVIDATGVPAAIEDALDAAARGASVMIFGVAPAEARVAVSPFRVYNDEITILGSMAVLHSFAEALDLMRAGTIDTGRMLTHAFPLDGFGDALQTVRDGGAVKAQVLPQA